MQLANYNKPGKQEFKVKNTLNTQLSCSPSLGGTATSRLLTCSSVCGDELILAGKLQLKQVQKLKPEKKSASDGAWTRASQIPVGRYYLRGSIRHLSPAGGI